MTIADMLLVLGYTLTCIGSGFALGLLLVLGYTLTCIGSGFALGLAIGSSNNTKK